jgi:hypothetical protein
MTILSSTPRSRTIVFVAASVAVWFGCSDSLGFDAIVTCADPQTVTVQVAATSPPRFTWQPACGMSSFQVYADTGSSGGWVVYSGSHAAENPLPSGIRYGQLPPDGIAPGGASPLIHGVLYDALVLRWVGDPGGPGALLLRGSVTFTP